MVLVGDHHDAGADPDPDGQGLRTLDRLCRLDASEARAYRALGGVLLRFWPTKIRLDAVAAVLRDVTCISRYRGAERISISLYDRFLVLGFMGAGELFLIHHLK